MIYVDPAMWPFRGALYCHMFCDAEDDIAELHTFAGALGMKRKWFQDRKNFPHYDLAPSKRKLAIERGAIEIDLMGMKQKLKDHGAWVGSD